MACTKAWLNYLKKNNKKAAYIRNYRETSNNELTCPYLSFQLDLGAPEKAIMNQVTDLWVVGKSQPKECDKLFSLEEKGYQTEERVWQRISLAAEGGSSSLIPYLKTLLPRADQYLADLYLKVRKDPSASAGLYRYKKKSAKEGQIAIYGVKRLVWRDKDLALRAWEKLETMFNYTDEQKRMFTTALPCRLPQVVINKRAFG